ncbi:MAG TPA: RNA polymerase sigma factor [Pirellulales bacterium]|nr:RNA polymerase sigma factor [Pirellulales bacterium]
MSETALSTDRVLISPTDDELLARFVASRDEESFRALVARHAPLVWRVCRQVSRQRADAEDAFQATFIALAQRAASIRQRASVSGWLYAIAQRTSWRLRVEAQRLREHPIVPEVSQTNQSLSGEEALALHAELGALPRKYRDPLVMRYLQGESLEQIAATLEVSPLVVKGRLQRGKRELRARLALRGVTGLSLAALVARTNSLAAEAVPQTAGIVERASQIVPGVSESAVPAGRLARRAATAGGKELTMIIRVIEALTLAGAAAVLGLAVPQREAATNQQSAAAPPAVLTAFAPGPQTLSYGDGTPDGKKSIAGTGEMIRFTAPADKNSLTGIAVHGARYGYPQPPNEDIKIYVLAEDGKKVLRSEKVPYARFERGESRWTELKFGQPVEVPKSFWIVADFDAAQTKGVYVSYDTSTGGQHSRTGLPGQEPKAIAFGGDWMIRAYLAE